MMGSTKKSPTKAGGSGYSAAKAHRQRASTPPEPSEAEASYSPAPSIESPTPTRASSKKKKSNLAKNWNFTHVPPKADDRRKNGRVEGRNLITWTREYYLSFFSLLPQSASSYERPTDQCLANTRPPYG